MMTKTQSTNSPPPPPKNSKTNSNTSKKNNLKLKQTPLPPNNNSKYSPSITKKTLVVTINPKESLPTNTPNTYWTQVLFYNKLKKNIY